jgi:hypothetical protein
MSNQLIQQLLRVIQFAPVAMKKLKENFKDCMLHAIRSVVATTLTVESMTLIKVLVHKLFPDSTQGQSATRDKLVLHTIRLLRRDQTALAWILKEDVGRKMRPNILTAYQTLPVVWLTVSSSC